MGPRIDPCVTPNDISDNERQKLFIVTRWCLLRK